MRRMLIALAALLPSSRAEPAPPAPQVSVVSASFNEGQTATVQLQRTGNLSQPSAIVYSTANATALAGTNYTAKSGSITFAKNQSVLTITVPTIRDFKVRGNLYFIVRLGVASNATIKANGTVTVRDIDVAAPPAVAWSQCGIEGGRCYLKAPANVRYGYGAIWTAPVAVTAAADGTVWIDCSNTRFGDPYVGQPKVCQTDGTPGTAPPPPPATQTCPDGTVILATATCPVVPPPPPPTSAWVSAPLRGGGWARVTSATDPDWDVTGPGTGRKLVVGEIVALYTSGWGVNYDGRISYAIHAMSDGGDGRAWEGSLEGLAPTGTPPALPADWYSGWLATGAKACADSFGRAGYPGTALGVTYRYTLWVGGRTQIALGATGNAGANFAAVPADNPYLGPVAVVTGDCLKGAQ